MLTIIERFMNDSYTIVEGYLNDFYTIFNDW